MEKTVDIFKKNALEEVRVSLQEYKSRQLFVVRVYYQTDDGEWRPGRNGISLAIDHFPALRSGVAKLEAAILEAGLLGVEDLDLTQD